MNRRAAFGAILGMPIGLGFAAGGHSAGYGTGESGPELIVPHKGFATLGIRVDTSDLEAARKKMDELANLPDEVKRNITITVRSA